MAVHKMGLLGLKCPQPSMKVAAQLVQVPKGDLIEAEADCATFEDDMRKVAQRWNKVIVSVKQKPGNVKVITIQA